MLRSNGFVLSHGFVQAHDLIRLRPLIPLHNIEFHLVAFLQAFVPIRLNGTVMDEDIGTIVTPNKPKSLGVVEPLHFSLDLSHASPCFLYELGTPADPLEI